MRIAITGAGGYIGRHLLKAGAVPLKCDVTEYNDVDRAIAQTKPELVIHLAGESNPDACEMNPKKTSTLNVRGTYHVMENCSKRRLPAVLLSSSQIWGGGWWESMWNKHSETSKFTPAINSYGMQKLAAESMASWLNVNHQLMKVIRTSFVFSRERLSADLYDLKHDMPIDAPTFIKRSFIHIDDFVTLLSLYCKEFYTMPHILHLAGSETVSYYDFWKEAARQFGFDRSLIKGRRVERNALYAAKRPHNGGLDVSLSQRLGFPSFDYIGGIERMKNESPNP